MKQRKETLTYDFLKGICENENKLVFVHGTGCNSKFLRPLADQFEEYDRYLINLPGHAGSDDTGYSAENYVNALKNFICDMDNVILIGHSLGGCIVIGAGELNLPCVKGLVVLNSAAKFYKVDPELKEYIINNNPDIMKRADLMLGHLDNPEVQEIAMLGENVDVFLKDCNISITLDYEENVKNINVPVCIIAGEKDMFSFIEFSEYLHSELKKSELHVIKDTMHSLPIIRKKEVHKIVNKFLVKIQ